MIGRNAWLSLLLASSTTCLPALSEPPKEAQAPIKGIEFTKIQDLNPTVRGTNRPIKQKWAIVVGLSNFQEGRLNPTDTGDMGKSAKEFYDYLTDPRGGRFDSSHVKLLVDSNASKQSIMSALGANFLGNVVGPDDLVVVYIATSGFPTTDGNTFLCSYDCALDNIYGTCISMRSLMSTLKENVKSDRIVLVLQAAYSGAAELESGAKSLEPVPRTYNLDLNKVVLGSGFIILTSSQPNEITWSNSFSKNLTTALRQEDGMISINKAFAIAKQQTESETAAVDVKKKQVPVMKSAWKGTDLVLGAPPAERVANLPASLNSFLSAEGAYLKANTLVAAGKTDDALEQYKLAIAADPKYADALADCGAAYTLKGDWKSAGEMYKKAIAVKPNDELFHLNYARVLDKLGESENSMQELQTAYSLNPKDMSVINALSNKSMAAGKTEDAVRYMEHAVDLYPGRADLRERLSYGFLKSGDIDQAVAQAKEAVRLDAKSASARTTLGSVLLVQGYVLPAVESYKEALKLKPLDDNIMWLLSKAMEKSGDRDGAVVYLQKFMETCSPSDPRAVQAKQHLEELKAR